MSPSDRRSVRLSCCGLLLLVGTVCAAPASAANWPGDAPCNTTLQACIDAQPAGGAVVIVSTTLIDESIQLTKAFTLRGPPGDLARFAPGRGIAARFGGDSLAAVTLARLALQDAHITLDHLGWGGAAFLLEHSQVVSSSAASAAGITVDLPVSGSAARSVTLRSNRLRTATPSSMDAGIDLRLSGSAVSADLRWNSVQAVGPTPGWGILAQVSEGATATLRLMGNEVRDGFDNSAIGISEGRWSGTPSTVVAHLANNTVVGRHGRTGGAIRVMVSHGSIDAQIINNTVTSSGIGVYLGRWQDEVPGTGIVTGRLFNNLLAFNRSGMQADPPFLAGISANYNLRYGVTELTGNIPLGANGINADPLLRAVAAPRLQADSPAIDAGNALALAFVPGLADHDGDGLRRLVGPAVDIGAHEFGQRSVLVGKHSATAETFVAVADPAIDAERSARLFPTVNFAASGVANAHPLGVFDFSEQWWIRNANNSNIPQHATFNLLAAGGTAATGVTVHAASGANTLDDSTLIQWAQVNGAADRIILFAQATPFGAVANPHPVALRYAGGFWNLSTGSAANFTTPTQWHLYAQAPSPNAFRHVVGTSALSSKIDHPLLNDTRCAQLHVSALAHGGANGLVYDVDYAASRWRLYSNSGAFSAGAQFNVLVLPEQVERCTVGRLFRDGLEPLSTPPVAVP
jgi:hypothetical protein